MPRFRAADGTELAYHVQGEGTPMVCLPGGPGRASAYLGDLSGLSAHRQLIMLDVRGTGESAIPADPASYRCDRLVGGVDLSWPPLVVSELAAPFPRPSSLSSQVPATTHGSSGSSRP
jgi:pimeloyl-ACP methyl ester carboxylesterase